MARRSEPNAQNSKLNPAVHPDRALIEKLYRQADIEYQEGQNRLNESGEKATTSFESGEKGIYGETLRPSERETFQHSQESGATTWPKSGRVMLPMDEPAEGGRDGN
jgi:hypothetical protein